MGGAQKAFPIKIAIVNMKLICLHVFRWQPNEAVLLASGYELSMLWFYQRGIAREHLLHNSRLVAS